MVDEAGNAEIHKTSTTPGDPSIGFFRGLQKAADQRAMQLDDFLQQVETIVHGTTITTNAVLTGDGANTGFVTTRGFRDVLNMRRGLKERQFEKYAPPPALVPRRHIQPVEERINVQGEILVPLNEEDIRAAARYFREQGVEAVAVSFLWSFRNPSHELRVREILEQELPGIYVSLSTEILPQIRLYERNSTTALNAYVGPVLTRYISRLLAQLEAGDFTGNLLIMQSNGGVMSPQVAQRYASNTLLSGPAGAPMAGVFYGNTHGFRNVITIDMGGTSFDVALVKDAEPAVTTEGMIGEHRIASPILDIHTIGAGGGSIAWIDRGGLLAVGPKSAGAAPGPACYGRGGSCLRSPMRSMCWATWTRLILKRGNWSSTPGPRARQSTNISHGPYPWTWSRRRTASTSWSTTTWRRPWASCPWNGVTTPGSSCWWSPAGRGPFTRRLLPGNWISR